MFELVHIPFLRNGHWWLNCTRTLNSSRGYQNSFFALHFTISHLLFHFSLTQPCTVIQKHMALALLSDAKMKHLYCKLNSQVTLKTKTSSDELSFKCQTCLKRVNWCFFLLSKNVSYLVYTFVVL